MTLLKTKDISDRLDVNPTTVQRWTKFFGIEHKTNEHGHYVYKEQQIATFAYIQKQLQEGKKMKDIAFNGQTKRRTAVRIPSVPKEQYEAKLEKVLVQVNDLEEKLSTKADDIVSYQLLKHRSELDEMVSLIEQLEKRLEAMDEKMSQHLAAAVNEQPRETTFPNKVRRGPWRAIMKLFSFA
ncbi:chromosome-anchoring protein RacA [Bacillus sp. FSL W7-1360]